jgi:hypothetical protein
MTRPPDRPARARRLLSAGADLFLALALTRLLASSTGAWLTERSIPMLHIGSPDTIWRGPFAMGIALAGPLVYGFPLAWLLLAAAGPIGGASAGQVLAGLRIVPPDGRSPFLSRCERELARSGPAVLLLAGLLASSWPLALASVVGLAALVIGWLPVLRGGRALHDRLAGTAVVGCRRSPRRKPPVPGPRTRRVR